MNEKRGISLTGFDLRMIATVTMVIDHIGACGLVRGDLNTLFRCIGRVAFPIYCFLLAEGAMRTRNMMKYLGRILIFALVSELPYDLLMHRRLWYAGNQNILWTLLAALTGIAAYRLSRTKWKGTWKEILGPIAMVAMLLLAEHLRFDYGWQGVLLIYAMYIWRSEMQRIKYPYLLLVVLLFGSFWWNDIEILALLAFLPCCLYNGEKGPKCPGLLFYAFYPAHLLVLLGLCFLLGQRSFPLMTL